MKSLDVLSIGNITKDIIENDSGNYFEIGGSSFYASRVCEELNLKSGIISSLSKDLPLKTLLPYTEFFSQLGNSTTTFVNSYRNDIRIQRVLSEAASIDLSKFKYPSDWDAPKIVFICPVLNEVSNDFFNIFEESKKICNLQGWMRSIDEDGEIHSNKYLPNLNYSLIDVVVTSESDIEDEHINQIAKMVPMICVTRGRKGCTVISDNDQIDYKTEKIKAIDETGAGDVWATVFSISRFIRAFEINESVEMANIAAAISLGGVGSKNIPSLDQIINYKL